MEHDKNDSVVIIDKNLNSDIIKKNGPPIQVYYRLIKNINGKWYIYDFGVDGISITHNYHAQFINIIEHDGLAVLIKQLHEKNALTKKL